MNGSPNLARNVNHDVLSNQALLDSNAESQFSIDNEDTKPNSDESYSQETSRQIVSSDEERDKPTENEILTK